MKLIKRGKDGLSVISDSGREYQLLEGKSLEGESTSDICFIFDFGNKDEGTKWEPMTPALVDWCFGANFVSKNSLEYLKNTIIKYESVKLGIEQKEDYEVIKEF